MKLGELIVEIGADPAQLDQALATSKTKLKRFSASARTATNNVGKLGAASAVAGAAILAKMVASSAQAAKEIKNLSRVAGVAPEKFQKMAFAASRYGVQQDDLASMLKDFQDRVGEFLQTGGGPMQDFFKHIAPQIGVTAQQFRGLSGPQAMQLYVSTLQKANLSQSEMTFYMEAMASESTRLIPLMKDSGAKLKELSEQAENAGLALSSIEVQSLNQVNKSIETATAAFTAFTRHLSASLGPTIQAVVKWLGKATDEAGGLGEVGKDVGQWLSKAFLFVADVVAGVKRAFDLAAQTMVLGFLYARKGALEFNNFLVGNVAKSLSKIIKLSNEMLGTDFDDPFADVAKNLEQNLKLTNRAIEIGKKELQKTLMEPLPSDVLKPMVADAKKQMKQAAEAAQEARKAAAAPIAEPQSQPVKPTGDKGKSRQEQIAAQKRAEMELKRLQAQLNAKFAIKMQYRVRLRKLDKLYDQLGLKHDQRYKKMTTALEAAKQKKLTALAKQGAHARVNVAQAEGRATLSTLGGTLGKLTRLQSSESKRQFEIGKKAGVAKSLISTYTGAAKALELGWPMGMIAAAAVIATGLNNVNTIKSQTFSGGGSKASGGGASGAASVASAAPMQQQQSQPEPSRTANISITGSTFSRESVMQMAGEMEKLSKDGYEFNLT